MTTTTETKTTPPTTAAATTTTTTSSSSKTTAPELPTVAQKVAHDMRGALGVLRSVCAELDGDDVADADSAAVAVDQRRLLQMAERALHKLERTASRLEAVAHRQRQPAADVDLEPMVQRAAESTALVERRSDAQIDIAVFARPTRVRVVASSLEPVLHDVFRWALRLRDSVLNVTTATAAEVTLQVRMTTTTSVAAPAHQVPFQDPLGLAALLLEDMGGSLAVTVDGHAVLITITLPTGTRV